MSESIKGFTIAALGAAVFFGSLWIGCYAVDYWLSHWRAFAGLATTAVFMASGAVIFFCGIDKIDL